LKDSIDFIIEQVLVQIYLLVFVCLFTFVQYFCLFCLLLGVWIQGFVLARQVLYHLSHISSPFCNRVSFVCLLVFFSWGGLNFDPPINASCSNWADRCTLTHPAIVWDGVLWTFLPRLAWNHDLPNLCLLHS
jgi:hypothetical protein